MPLPLLPELEMEQMRFPERVKRRSSSGSAALCPYRTRALMLPLRSYSSPCSVKASVAAVDEPM